MDLSSYDTMIHSLDAQRMKNAQMLLVQKQKKAQMEKHYLRG